MSGKRLLTIPRRPLRTGDATFAEKARGGRPDYTSAPLIRSFEGTSFVEDWLSTGPRTDDESGALPDLVPFRDWTEPPQALITASGEPKWAPGEVEREPNPANPIGDFGTDGATLEGGIPAPDGELDWVRKLYLPAHDRFHILASELVCLQPTLPSVSRSRIEEVGVVIRRLSFDEHGERTEQDWVARNDERGRWIDLSRYDALAEPDAPVDRRLDPSNPPKQAALRLALGEPTDKKMVVRTGSGAVLANEAGEPGRTIAWATLPLTSSEQQVFVDEIPDTTSEFADELVADIAPDFDGTDGEIHARVSTAFIELVDDWIPLAPAASALSSAQTKLANYCLVPSISDTPEDIIQRRIEQLFSWLWTHPDVDIDDATTWFQKGVTAADSPLSLPFLPPFTVDKFDFEVLLRHEVRQRWASLRTALETRTSLTSVERRTMNTWSAVAAGRVRSSRIAIVELVYAALEAEFGEDIGLDDVDEQVSASTLALEIDNWISAEEDRVRTPRPWSALPFLTGNSQKIEVHRAARSMEREFAAVRERLSPAGPAYSSALNVARAKSNEVDVSPWNLTTVHLDWNGELEAGLLAFPTPHLTEADLVDFVGESGAVWKQAKANTDLRLLADRAQTQLLPRYDSDHLYVARLFARVAGPHPCDPVEIVWSKPTEPFVIAAHGDLLGIRPVAFEAPNIPKLLADIPKMARAGANPFAHVLTPENSGYDVGDEMGDTKRSWELAMICSFGIPIFTICAMIIFKIIFTILITIPGFVWMLLLKFCIPIPRRTS